MVLRGNSSVYDLTALCLFPASARVTHSRIRRTTWFMYSSPLLLFGVFTELLATNIGPTPTQERHSLMPEHRYPPSLGIRLTDAHLRDERRTNTEEYRNDDYPRSAQSDIRATTPFSPCLRSAVDEMNASPDIGMLLAELWSIEEGSGVPLKDFTARFWSLVRAKSCTEEASPTPLAVTRTSPQVRAYVSPDAEWLDWSTGKPHDGWQTESSTSLTGPEGHYRCSPCSAGQLGVLGNEMPASGPKKEVASKDPYFLRAGDGFGARFWRAVDRFRNKFATSGGPPSDAIKALYQTHNEDNAEFEAGFET